VRQLPPFLLSPRPSLFTRAEWRFFPLHPRFAGARSHPGFIHPPASYVLRPSFATAFLNKLQDRKQSSPRSQHPPSRNWRTIFSFWSPPKYGRVEIAPVFYDPQQVSGNSCDAAASPFSLPSFLSGPPKTLSRFVKLRTYATFRFSEAPTRPLFQVSYPLVFILLHSFCLISVSNK